MVLENVSSTRRDCQDVVQLLRVQANAKNSLSKRVSPEVPPFLRRCPPPAPGVDQSRHQCHQVHRAGRSNDGCGARSPGGRAATVRFTITDTGIGIQPEQIAALFSPFVQADTSTHTQVRRGRGLGLTICKQLVDMMGGAIGVNSKAGQGSTFWFTAVFETECNSHPKCHQPLR